MKRKQNRHAMSDAIELHNAVSSEFLKECIKNIWREYAEDRRWKRGADMKYNMTIVYDKALEKALFCVRKKDPYKNKLNLIGGKIEAVEGSLEAAYRELEEETGIRKEQVTPLTHLIDFVYYDSNRFIEFYVTRLVVDNVVLVPELDGNDLKWVNLDGTDFGNTTIFAGDGNILHCVMMANKYWRKNNVENRE